MFIVAAELAIPTAIPTKEAKAEIETDPVTIEGMLSITEELMNLSVLLTF